MHDFGFDTMLSPQISIQLLRVFHRNTATLGWNCPKVYQYISILLYVHCYMHKDNTLLWSHQNPLQFVLRGAQIYPNKLALAHPDVESPVYYSYSIWWEKYALCISLLVIYWCFIGRKESRILLMRWFGLVSSQVIELPSWLLIRTYLCTYMLFVCSCDVQANDCWYDCPRFLCSLLISCIWHA